jgi:hypothetical protein
MKIFSKQRAVVLAGGIGVAAFVPGSAEAHCGHAMWGQVWWWDTGSYDGGCVGKGDMPDPSEGCLSYDPYTQECVEGWWAYDCTC